MRKLLVLAFALAVPACVVGSDGSTPPPGDDGSGSNPDPGSGISGSIAADTTWSGSVDIVGATTIETGVTVTIMAGTTVNITSGVGSLAVKGSLDVQGAKGSEVQIIPSGGSAFTNINVSGTMTMSYGIQHGGGITTVTGGSVTVTDSLMYGASGDYLVMNGGTLDVQYSQLGADPGTTDTTHCNMHFGGTTNNVVFMHNRNIGSPYAIMLYGGQNVNLTLNNWEIGATSSADWVDSAPMTSADFTGSYFSGGYVPTPKGGAIFTGTGAGELANAPLTDAGIR